MGNVFDTFLYRPILTLLAGIYYALSLLDIPYALAFAVVILTILIRLIIYPLITHQLKASKKMQTVAPHISKLREKHKRDAARLQQETMRLYKEHGVNPASGCLPVLIQLPIIWTLYSVLQKIVTLNPKEIVSYVNSAVYIDTFSLKEAWDPTFFGIPLGQHPSGLISQMPLIILVPIATGLFQFIQSKMMFSGSQSPQDPYKKKDKKQEAKKEGDFATMFQTQSLYIFPAMIGFFSYTFPIGLSLYWNTFTIFGILQQHKEMGLGGIQDWIVKVKGVLYGQEKRK